MEKAGISAGIKGRAYELGYDLCGVIPASSLKEYSARLDERIRHFPQSRHLYEKLYDLASPEKTQKWARSVIVLVRRYSSYRIPAEASRYFGKVYLFDGRLPYSTEYKNAMQFEAYLRSLGFELFKDSVAARWAAVTAGLGRFGRNNFLYTKYGSWVWVDTWTVSAELEYDGPVAATEACPKNCRKCIDACPTKALSGPFAMDRGACIAHLSFFSFALPPEPVRERMGAWLYGCDVCQDVCPMNKNKWAGGGEFPGLDAVLDILSPDAIARMDEKTFLERLKPRFWYIGKESFWLWKCNALRAMANDGNASCHPYIRQALADSDENVRAMADWARRKLGI